MSTHEEGKENEMKWDNGGIVLQFNNIYIYMYENAAKRRRQEGVASLSSSDSFFILSFGVRFLFYWCSLQDRLLHSHWLCSGGNARAHNMQLKWRKTKAQCKMFGIHFSRIQSGIDLRRFICVTLVLLMCSAFAFTKYSTHRLIFYHLSIKTFTNSCPVYFQMPWTLAMSQWVDSNKNRSWRRGTGDGPNVMNVSY